jgi:transposase
MAKVVNFFSDLLNILPPFHLQAIVKVHRPEQPSVVEKIVISVSLAPDYVAPEGFRIHSWHRRTWQHLSIFEYPCYLECDVPMFQDKTTKKTSQLSVPWARPYSGFTLLYEQVVLDYIQRVHNLSAVADLLGLYRQRVETIYDHYTIQAYENRQITVSTGLHSVEQIGIDETSTKKGHEYITIFVDMVKGDILAIEEGKSGETVCKFAKKIDKTALKEVSMDMSPAFVSAVQKELPQARITFDKFHIYRHIFKYLEQIEDGEKKDFAVQEVENLYTQPDLEAMAGFLAYWIDWVKEDLKAEKLAKSLKAHFDGIVNYARTNLTNGLLEGINRIGEPSKIQTIKKVARGYRYKQNFARMILFVFGRLATKII